MSAPPKKIKFCYALNEVSSRSFIIMIPRESTCADVLKLISEKQKDTYEYIFFEGSEISPDDTIYELWESDPETIFVASKTPDAPTAEFIQSVILTKTGGRPKVFSPATSSSSVDTTASSSKKETPAGAAASPFKPPGGGAAASPFKPPGAGAVAAPMKPPGGGAAASPFKPPGAGAVAAPVKVPAATPGKPIGADSSGGGAKLLTPKVNTARKTDAEMYTQTNNQECDIRKSMIHNGHEAGIYADKVEPRVDRTDKYQFYFTGGDKDMLLKGIDVDLDTSMNPNQARDQLLNYLKDKIDISNKQLLIYLPGGIPFIAGTLGDIYLKKDLKVKQVIYGVLTRLVPDAVLKGSYPELCNVSDPERKKLISPLVDSTDRGLSDMACLMGYLNHDGVKGDLLLRTCATAIHFPPLITSMNRIIERNQVVGRDVITVTSTLYTFFRAYLPASCPDNKVYEYALRLCNLISHINDPPEKIPMMNFEVIPGEPSTKFLSDLKLGPIVYFWKGDTGDDFPWIDLKIQSEEAIENAYNLIASFTPIAPLSMRNATGCSIVKGKDHEYLYLMQSPSKDSKSQNMVEMVDPMSGMVESSDVESFAKAQGNTKIDSTANLIDPDRVKQIIMVNFDESKSMIGDLAGYVIPAKSQKDHRVTIAYQYLTTFANRTYGYRIPCIQGLVSFNNNIVVRCPLSPLVPDFEDKGLKKIRPDSTTKLWDSLARSCDELTKFRKDSRGKEIYKNAISRILVISDGEDLNSSTKVQDVVKELIKNKIIVDSVIISTEDECKMLCAVCHATGGLSFRPKDVKEGLALFEQSAFLNYEERKNRSDPLIPGDRATIPSRLKPDQITEDFMNKARDNAKFDEEVQNKELIQAAANVRLATPRHVCAKNRDARIPSPRQRRILRELHAAAEANDPDSPSFDPDMKVYTFQSNLDRWRVYLKGPEGTPYANKWWYLYVTFPELYPVQPPIFRFVSVPYHLNVSLEGRICLNIIEKGYISSKHVVEILQEIKELFLLPSIDTPIQIETFDIFQHDKLTYERLAKESADKNAKDDYNDFVGSSLVVDDVPEGFTIEFTEHVPPYMVSQISGKPLQKNKMVKASTGVYYDKDELRQLVSSNRNPICVITGKPLLEKPEDLTDDDPDNDAI